MHIILDTVDYIRSLPETDIELLAEYLNIQELHDNAILDDIIWLIAIKLHNQKGHMESVKNVPVVFGKYTKEELDEKYNNLGQRIQDYANEAGIKDSHRHFDFEKYINFAIDKGIADQSIDDIIITFHYQQMKDLELEEEISEFMKIEDTDPEKFTFPFSLSGKQCKSNCVKGVKGCYCKTDPYKGWSGTYDWDYCAPVECERTMTI